MKKQNLILAAILTVALATGAQAGNANTGFDPILDADFLDAQLHTGATGGKNYVAAADPLLDADIIEFTLQGLQETGRIVDVGFHPILDADFGMGAGEYGKCSAATDVARR